MAGSSRAPIVDRIRILPRDQEFLDRYVGASGDLFFNRDSSSLRIFDGKARGGSEVASRLNFNQIAAYSGVASITYNVTVAEDSETDTDKFVINDEYSPSLTFVAGYTYVFNQDDNSNLYFPNEVGTFFNQHPLLFATTADGVDNEDNSTLYETGVRYYLDGEEVERSEYLNKFISSDARYIQITVTPETPATLYYYCNQHSGEGGEITTALPGASSGSGVSSGGASITISETAPETPTAGNLWFDSSSGNLYVYYADIDTSQWVQPSSSLPDRNSFGTILINGDSSTLSATEEDTLNIIAGSGITLVGDPETNTLTISSTGVSGSGSVGNFLFDASVMTTDDSSSITVVPATTFNSDVIVENTLFADSIQSSTTGVPVISSASTLTLSAADGLTFDGIVKSNETVQLITGATSVVDHNTNLGSVFYHSSIVGNFTVNFTNIRETENRTTSIALILDQGSSAYLPTVVQINSVPQTINWLGGEEPTGNINQIDIVSFTMIRTNSIWTVVGSLSTFA